MKLFYFIICIDHQ